MKGIYNRIMELLKPFVHKTLFFMFKFLPIDNRKIVFITLHSDKFTGNNKFIYDGLGKKTLNLTIKLFGMDDIKLSNLNPVEKIIKTIKIDYHICTTKYIIINDYFSLFRHVKVRKETELIQVWHAVGAFKKFGLDSLQSLKNKQHKNNITRVHSQYTKVIASSSEITPMYASAFGVDVNKVYPIGIPKTDVFFDKVKIRNKRNSFFDKYPNLKDNKIILYAPTFRDDDRSRTDLGLDLNFMYNSLSDKYVVIIKMHPFERGKVKITDNLEEFVLDLSHEEVDDLLLVSDYLISDYSTVIFEYAILKRPIILFAYDLEKYENELRGFYYNYTELVPGPVAKTSKEVVNLLLKDEWDFVKIEKFARRFNAFYDGKATKRFVDEVLCLPSKYRKVK